MSRPAVRVFDARAVALGPDPVEPDAIVAGDPVATGAALARWSDGSENGVWRVEPGVFTDVEVEETFVVLDGRATIEHEGSVYELGPGSICVFAEGAQTRWTVTETILKAYVIRG